MRCRTGRRRKNAWREAKRSKTSLLEGDLIKSRPKNINRQRAGWPTWNRLARRERERERNKGTMEHGNMETRENQGNTGAWDRDKLDKTCGAVECSSQLQLQRDCTARCDSMTSPRKGDFEGASRKQMQKQMRTCSNLRMFRPCHGVQGRPKQIARQQKQKPRTYAEHMNLQSPNWRATKRRSEKGTRIRPGRLVVIDVAEWPNGRMDDLFLVPGTYL